MGPCLGKYQSFPIREEPERARQHRQQRSRRGEIHRLQPGQQPSRSEDLGGDHQPGQQQPLREESQRAHQPGQQQYNGEGLGRARQSGQPSHRDEVQQAPQTGQQPPSGEGGERLRRARQSGQQRPCREELRRASQSEQQSSSGEDLDRARQSGQQDSSPRETELDARYMQNARDSFAERQRRMLQELDILHQLRQVPGDPLEPVDNPALQVRMVVERLLLDTATTRRQPALVQTQELESLTPGRSVSSAIAALQDRAQQRELHSPAESTVPPLRARPLEPPAREPSPQIVHPNPPLRRSSSMTALTEVVSSPASSFSPSMETFSPVFSHVRGCRCRMCKPHFYNPEGRLVARCYTQCPQGCRCPRCPGTGGFTAPFH
jgi:hypothetical protein